jgi:hypothetical protein
LDRRKLWFVLLVAALAAVMLAGMTGVALGTPAAFRTPLMMCRTQVGWVTVTHAFETDTSVQGLDGVDGKGDLLVRYELDPAFAAQGWRLRRMQVAVGDTPSEIPMRLGEPVTYLFPWRVSLAPGVTAYTFRIPVAECGLIDGEGVVFAAHADIRKGLFERDAWGQGNRFPWSRRGAMYFIVDCTNPKPPV